MPTYFITGCNRGLGLEWIHQLLSTPSTPSNPTLIIATTRRPSPELTSLSTSHPKTLHVLDLDISDHATLPTRLPSLLSPILPPPSSSPSGGSRHIDFLLNNAGANIHNASTALTFRLSAVPESIHINVATPILLTRLLLPYLRAGSVVVNLTSGVGSLTRMLHDEFTVGAPYAISKAAVNMWSVMLAQDAEVRKMGVRVCVVDPGHCKTEMGGDGATMEVAEGVGGMRELLGRLGGEGGGGLEVGRAKFYLYDGREVPW